MLAMQHSKGSVCVKFYNSDNSKEVSITFDDSCKSALPTIMRRASMCIYEGETNITQSTFGIGELCDPSTADLITALQTLI